MIPVFRAFYLSRSLREKVLLLGFVVILLGVWFSQFSGQVVGFARQSHLITVQLDKQEKLLADRDAITASAQQAASRFNPSSTLSGLALTAAVTNLAENVGLNNVSANEDPDLSEGPFAVHRLRFEIPKADWQSLLTFFYALQKRHPYISIDQVQILQDRANHAQTANLVVSSVEIAPSAAP